MKVLSIKLWLLILLFLNGCGYHLVGTGSTLPKHLKTLSIPVFTNSSTQPEIHRELTSSVINAFITDGRVRVARKAPPDMVMNGNVTHYEVKTVSFNSNNFATGYIVVLGVNVEVIDRIQGKSYMKQSLSTEWNYTAGTDIVDLEAARLAALDEAYRLLGNRLVSLLINPF
jgi:outer membrane lipopolysaccharide assembly protein LptE/RlpB